MDNDNDLGNDNDLEELLALIRAGLVRWSDASPRWRRRLTTTWNS